MCRAFGVAGLVGSPSGQQHDCVTELTAAVGEGVGKANRALTAGGGDDQPVTLELAEYVW